MESGPNHEVAALWYEVTKCVSVNQKDLIALVS